MAAEPPTEVVRPPDLAQNVRNDIANITQQTASSNSTHNFSNQQNSEAMTMAFSDKGLEWIRKIGSLPHEELERVCSIIGGDYSSLDAAKSEDSVVQIANLKKAILEIAAKFDPQIRTTSGEIRGEMTTGDCSSHPSAPITKNLVDKEGVTQIPITGDGAPVITSDQIQCQMNQRSEVHAFTSKAPINPTPNASNLQTEIQTGATISPELHNQIRPPSGQNEGGAGSGVCCAPPGAPPGKKSGELEGGGDGTVLFTTGGSAPFISSDEGKHQNDRLNGTSQTIPKALNSTGQNSTNLSSKILPPLPISDDSGAAVPEIQICNSQYQPVSNSLINTNPSKAPSNCDPIGANLSSRVLPRRLDGGATAAMVQSQNWQCQTLQNDRVSANTSKAPSQTTPILSNLQTSIKKLGNLVDSTAPVVGKNNSLPENTSNDSTNDSSQKNNFFVYPNSAPNSAATNSEPEKNNLATVSPNPTSVIDPKNSHIPRSGEFPPMTSNFQKYNANSSKNPEIVLTTSALPPKSTSQSNPPLNTNHPPPPPTNKQSWATRFRVRQADSEPKIDLTPPKRATKQGCPAVMFKRDDYMVKMAESCKYTLIGKFNNPMPKMEVIRKSFITQTELRGNVKITHYNFKHIYIDLDNEYDRATVLDSKRMYINGALMRFQVWTPTFDPNYETPILPVWVVLPELPWHCYYKDFVALLLADVGQVLHLDMAFMQKTRGSVAKVKVQMDITKPRIDCVWVGFDDDDDPNGEGRWQVIQYEDIPLYCTYCKHQGHAFLACVVKKRDEERKKAKEQEEAKKATSLGNSAHDANHKDAHQQSVANIPDNNDKVNSGPATGGNNQVKSQNHNSQYVISNAAASVSGTKDIQPQNHPEKEKPNSEEWQTQKNKNFRGHNQNYQKNTIPAQQNKVYKPVPPRKRKDMEQPKQQEIQTGIDSMLPIPKSHGGDVTPTPRISPKQVQNKQGMEAKETTGIDSMLHQPHPNNLLNVLADKQGTEAKDSTGIDSMLHQPHPNNCIVLAGSEKSGGEDGGMKEKITNLQEGDPKGGGRPCAMHEDKLVDPVL